MVKLNKYQDRFTGKEATHFVFHDTEQEQDDIYNIKDMNIGDKCDIFGILHYLSKIIHTENYFTPPGKWPPGFNPNKSFTTFILKPYWGKI